MTTRLRKRLLTAVTAVTAAAVLTGCVGLIKSDAPSQVDQIGKVRISTDLCIGLTAAGSLLGDPSEGCRDYEDALGGAPVIPIRTAAKRVATRTGDRPTHTDMIESLLGGVSLSQVLVAYRVPTGAEAPSRITGDVRLDPDFVDDVNGFVSPLLWDLAWAPASSPDPAPAISTSADPSPVRPIELPKTISFTRNASYTAELAALEPAGAGQKWVGYVSEQMPMLVTGDLKLNADFTLPEGPNGQPYAGPFPHVTTTGVRLALSRQDIESLALSADVFLDAIPFLEGEIMEALSYLLDEEDGPFREIVRGAPVPDESLIDALEAELGPDRDVVCADEGDDVDRGVSIDTTEALCLTDPADGVVTNRSLSTRDLVITGGDVSAEQGSVAQVPFTLDYSGPAATQAMALETENEIPYAGGVQGLGAYQPGANEDIQKVVPVAIPADARPGTYDVILRAGLPAALQAGDAASIREGVAKVTVTAKPQAPGQITVASLSRPLERLYVGRNGTVAFGFVCPENVADDCEKAVADVLLNIRALGGARGSQKKVAFKMTRIGRKRFEAKAGKRVRVKVKIGKRGRRVLRNGKRINARIVIKAGKYKQVRKVSLRRG